MNELKTYIIDPLINILRYHKFKMIFLLFTTFIFYIILFPYYLLTPMIQDQINRGSRGQSQISFEDLGLSFNPLGISAKNIYITSSQTLTPLYIGRAYILPSLVDFLSFKSGFHIMAKDFLGGSLRFYFARLGQGTSKNKKSKMVRLQADFKSVKPQALAEWLKAPLTTGGELSGSFDLDIDLAAFEKPKGQFKLTGEKIKLPKSIKIMQMDLSLPEGELKKLNIQGFTKNDQLTIKESSIGESSDIIHGKFKGLITFRSKGFGGQLKIRPTDYNLSMDLVLSKETEEQVGNLLSKIFLGSQDGKSPTVDGGARYILSVAGFPGKAPEIKPLSSF